MRRCLVGPVSPTFATNQLRGPRQAGACLAFGNDGPLDLTVASTDRWKTLCRRLPADWRPNFLAVPLAAASQPVCLWAAPVPVVGLAPDWDLSCHSFRLRAPHCDLVLTDPQGVDACARLGLDHAPVRQPPGHATQPPGSGPARGRPRP